MSWYTADGEGVRLTVKVQPRSNRNQVVGVEGDALKVKITAPPVDGEANRALLEFLAEKLGVAKSRLRILNGESGRRKVIFIGGVGSAEVTKKLVEE
ncbi:MAG: uncharacterized protein PWQ31_197 [Eubacteriales bacterium]|nr:uncharacterized protein [Eubacteriales bacterium]